MKMMNFKKENGIILWMDYIGDLSIKIENFLKNPRLSMMVKIFDKLDSQRKNINSFRG